MREIAIWTAVLLISTSTAIYVVKIHRRKASPALATWLMFAIGSVLSLVTYLQEQEHDWRSGILNTVDIGTVSAILLAIIIRGDWSFKLEEFEKIYLRVALGIICVWILVQSGFIPNLLLQVLMTWAYLPTLQKMIREQRNTESFTVWLIMFAASPCGLYLAITGGKLLAVVYAARALVMTTITLAFMIRYELLSRKTMSKLV